MDNSILDSIGIVERLLAGKEGFNGLAYHSAAVKKGDLFVAIRGFKTDGHLFIRDALKKGASAAVVEEIIPDLRITQYRVSDSRQALARLAAAYYGHPSRNIILTGVTATNGKTTTTYMLHRILEKAGLNCGLLGTVVYKTGSRVSPSLLTTPESLDLQGYFREMAESGISHAVMEVSSSGLELKRVESVDFDTVVLNNISREHIDLHGSFDSYRRAKQSLIENAKKEARAVLNADCPYCDAVSGSTKAGVISYGLKNRAADCLVEDLDLSSGRARFTVRLKKRSRFTYLAEQPESFPLKLSVLGLHSVYNAMAAAVSALTLGVPAEMISEALLGFRGVERRFELIFDGDFMVIDDHFANAGNIDVTLETLSMMNFRQLNLVYAIRGSRGPTVNRENAEALTRWAPKLGLKKIYATTSEDHVGEKDLVTDEEKAVFLEVVEKAGLEAPVFSTLSQAVGEALDKTGRGDVLLLAGCQGMDYGAGECLKLIAERNPHLDRKEVLAPLENRVAGV